MLATAGARSVTRRFAATSANCWIITSRICWGVGRVCYLIWGVKVVTKATNADRTRRARPSRGLLAAGVLLLAGLPGCASMPEIHFPWQPDPPSNRDPVVIPTSAVDRDPSMWHPVQKELRDAKQLIDEKRFGDAEKAFHAIDSDKKCPAQFREEALFFEAECQRLQKKYRGAEETYSLLFKDHPSTQFTERADRALFEIALHWLGET